MQIIARKILRYTIIYISCTVITIALMSINTWVEIVSNNILGFVAIAIYITGAMVSLIDNDFRPIAVVKYRDGKLILHCKGDRVELDIDEVKSVEMIFAQKNGKAKKYGQLVIHTYIDKQYVVPKVRNLELAYSKLLQVLNTHREDDTCNLQQTDEQAEETNGQATKPKTTFIHTMNVVTLAFDKIADGSKTIELRLFDAKRRTIKVNDKVKFVCKERQATIVATVKAMYVFDNFESLYQALPLDKCGYSEDELATASAKDMLQYYTQNDIDYYGVVGIQLADVSVTGNEQAKILQ